MSCSTQKRLSRNYVGKDVSVLKEQFGNPSQIKTNGDTKILIFEEYKEIKPTVINQGKPTLDPIVSPGTTRRSRYYFTVKKGKIVTVDYEEDYSR